MRKTALVTAAFSLVASIALTPSQPSWAQAGSKCPLYEEGTGPNGTVSYEIAGAQPEGVGFDARDCSFYTAGSLSVNAWDTFLSPIALYPVFAGVASAGVVALRRFANAQLAVRLGSYTWEQIHVLLGLLALLISVGYFFHDHGGLDFR